MNNFFKSISMSVSLSALFTIVMVGCGAPSTSVVVNGILLPEIDGASGSCSFDANSDVFMIQPTLDVSSQKSLFLVAQVQNLLSNGTSNFDEASNADVVSFPNAVTPRRFDYRFECETNGFSFSEEILYLPQYSVTDPFCVDDRRESQDFIGFDEVPASGSAISPQALGLVEFRPVPPSLGEAMDEMFDIASLSESCCEQVGGSCVVTSSDVRPGTACGTLQDLFNAVSNGTPPQVTNPETLARYVPFTRYVDSSSLYTVTMKGTFSFISGAGEEITSNELVRTVGICQGCVGSVIPCTE